MTVSYPDPPDDLLDSTVQRWVAFWESDSARMVDHLADMPRLIRWIEQLDEYDRVVEKMGRDWLVRGSTGNEVLNPLARYLAQLDTQLARTETEFGMTPMGRKKLSLKAEEPAPAVDPLDELALRRTQRASGA